MTLEEAVVYVNRKIRFPYDVTHEEYNDTINALNIAVQAIDKQIPKEPMDIYVCIPVMGTCPVCGVRLDDSMKHCYSCGQALDWNPSEKPIGCGGDNHAAD